LGIGIAVDKKGRAYVSGQTSSDNFPTTEGAVQPSFGGETDAFVVALTRDATAFLYSTYLGGDR
jgi:hypothetical protein